MMLIEFKKFKISNFRNSEMLTQNYQKMIYIIKAILKIKKINQEETNLYYPKSEMTIKKMGIHKMNMLTKICHNSNISNKIVKNEYKYIYSYFYNYNYITNFIIYK